MDHASLNLLGFVLLLILALVPYFAILTLFNINQTLRDLLWEVQLTRVDVRPLLKAAEELERTPVGH
jgi:hypothetical protein